MTLTGILATELQRWWHFPAPVIGCFIQTSPEEALRRSPAPNEQAAASQWLAPKAFPYTLVHQNDKEALSFDRYDRIQDSLYLVSAHSLPCRQ